MNSAMSIAVSGMSAASARFTAAASRIVGAMAGPSSPLSATQTTGSVSGPLKGSLIAFGNSLDPVNDIASEITASLVYKANLKSFEAASKMMKSTLDMIA